MASSICTCSVRPPATRVAPIPDVDLFFDHAEGSLGLFQLMDIKEAAARILGRKTDIMTRRCFGMSLKTTCLCFTMFAERNSQASIKGAALRDRSDGVDRDKILVLFSRV